MTTVLVTRPAGQAQVLVQALRARGFDVLHRPALAIEPLTPAPQEQALLARLAQQQLIIVVSANAARLLPEHADLAAARHSHWLAVGQATAEALAELGLPVRVPPAGSSSEALLAMPLLQAVHGLQIAILAGEGGRDTLAEELSARGARVQSVALYRRTCDAQFSWPTQPVDIVMVTSLQGWRCLAGQVPATVTVLAGSERIAQQIRAEHPGEVISADSPMDSAMLAALETLS